MKKTILITLLFVLSLTACAQIKNFVATDKDIESGQVLSVIKSVSLTDTEATVLNHALNAYTAFVEKWKHEDVIGDRVQFLAEFSALKEQYRAVDNIVSNHWQEYDPERKKNLLRYQQAAKHFNDSAEKLASLEKWDGAIKNAVSLAKVLAGIARALPL
ncbi:MAG: hypothetical protein K2Q14_06980 [Gammaproteobacteria bacterium]|nr:hypothetical protein [Nitrosomonas sp.]MBY0545271.1 hypothetical protein [Gammaproteobacteria bacterium]